MGRCNPVVEIFSENRGSHRYQRHRIPRCGEYCVTVFKASPDEILNIIRACKCYKPRLLKCN